MEENKVVENVVETGEAPVDAPVQNTEEKGAKKDFKKKKFDKRPARKEATPKEYEERVVAINRVSKTVKGGRRMKFSALVVIGNGKGKYGFATGKSSEVPDAIKKALDKAKRETKTVNIVNDGSIQHEVVGKYGATTVFLKPAKAGTGIIAGGPVRAILELSGVKNVYSKVYGSRTAINIIRATVDALSQLKSYKEVQLLRKGGTEDAK